MEQPGHIDKCIYNNLMKKWWQQEYHPYVGCSWISPSVGMEFPNRISELHGPGEDRSGFWNCGYTLTHDTRNKDPCFFSFT